jgi:hypothetical protein
MNCHHMRFARATITYAVRGLKEEQIFYTPEGVAGGECMGRNCPLCVPGSGTGDAMKYGGPNNMVCRENLLATPWPEPVAFARMMQEAIMAQQKADAEAAAKAEEAKAEPETPKEN